MARHLFCLFCTVLLLAAAVPASAEETGGRYSYDFDLTFSLNADAFPAVMRSRAAGYASLANRLGIRGNLAWSDETKSMDLDAVIYYTDRPSLTYPIRFFGTRSWLFCTSPIMNDAVLFFDLNGLMEYAVKVKNTLALPMPYLAFLYPYTTEYAFSGVTRAWQQVIGTFRKSKKVTVARLQELSELCAEEFKNSPHPQRWVSALADGSESPDAIEAEFASLPGYYQLVTGGKPLSVTVGKGSETWQDSKGQTLFSREETDDSLSLSLALPASENGYEPAFSLSRSGSGSAVSFTLSARVARAEGWEDPQEDSAAEEEYAEEEYTEEYDDEYAEAYDAYDDYGEGYTTGSDEYDDYGEYGGAFPDLLLDFTAEGSDLPLAFPADASFSVSASMRGAAYPDFDFRVIGETKADGSLTLSLCKAFAEGDEPATIFSCTGTAVPAEPKDIPDYQAQSLDGVYNIFAFNEISLSDFSHNVLPPLVRSLFSFVAEAPTAACQSFLDDLTDSGVLDMLLE